MTTTDGAVFQGALGWYFLEDYAAQVCGRLVVCYVAANNGFGPSAKSITQELGAHCSIS